MRKNETARRKGIFGDLFAERQVYLRSGLTSRYVVLSRPLQIGVAIGMGLVIAWLAVASYSSIAKHFEVAGQNRELARLEEANKSLRTAAEAAQATGELRGQAARVPELTASLSAAEAGRERAESLTKAAVNEANELRRQLALAQDRLRELSTASQATGATAGAEGTRAAASDASKQLAQAQAKVGELSQALDKAHAEGETLAAQLADVRGSAEQRVAELTKRAETSEAEGKRLRGDLDAALKDSATLRQSAQTAEADLADLRAEVTRLRAQPPAAGEASQDLGVVKQPAPATDEVAKLKATLASAETRITELTADLEAAKRAPAAEPTAAEPGGGADGQTVASLQAQLDAANQRLGELQAAIQSSVANLAPLPPPPAPR